MKNPGCSPYGCKPIADELPNSWVFFREFESFVSQDALRLDFTAGEIQQHDD
jgi:hypothetical protein